MQRKIIRGNKIGNDPRSTTRPDQLRVLVRILVRNLVRILVATNLVATNQPSPKVQPQARPKPTPEAARADLNPALTTLTKPSPAHAAQPPPTA